jgi:hypothetical protein
MFQSLTGSTGHLASAASAYADTISGVSIPNGLHRPFSLDDLVLIEHDILTTVAL